MAPWCLCGALPGSGGRKAITTDSASDISFHESAGQTQPLEGE